MTLEGQTLLDEDEKRDLIPYITTREELNRFEQENILEARLWVMQKSVYLKVNLFSEGFLKNLHKRMYGQVWKWAGTYRTSNKNIGVDRFLISGELNQLLGDAKYWLENRTYSYQELAIVFHHRLVKIHLFPNGNGRHARMLGDVICAKYKARPLSWGLLQYNEGTIDKETLLRKSYIEALRAADKGEYEALIQFAKN
jgi:Fic-DOC domain mobile mystery protein B